MAANDERPILTERLMVPATLLWSGFWTLGGIGAGLDPTDGTSLPAGLALAAMLGIAPCVPLWVGKVRRARKRRATAAARQASARAEVAALASTVRRERRRHLVQRLPRGVRSDWERLERARTLAGDLAEQGGSTREDSTRSTSTWISSSACCRPTTAPTRSAGPPRRGCVPGSRSSPRCWSRWPTRRSSTRPRCWARIQCR